VAEISMAGTGMVLAMSGEAGTTTPGRANTTTVASPPSQAQPGSPAQSPPPASLPDTSGWPERPWPAGMVWIPAGEFVMGTDDPASLANGRAALALAVAGKHHDDTAQGIGPGDGGIHHLFLALHAVLVALIFGRLLHCRQLGPGSF
jgi:hypothetical protein